MSEILAMYHLKLNRICLEKSIILEIYTLSNAVLSQHLFICPVYIYIIVYSFSSHTLLIRFLVTPHVVSALIG